MCVFTGFSDDKVTKVESPVKQLPVVETSSGAACRFPPQQSSLLDKEEKSSRTKEDVSPSYSQISSEPRSSGSLSHAGKVCNILLVSQKFVNVSSPGV